MAHPSDRGHEVTPPVMAPTLCAGITTMVRQKHRSPGGPAARQLLSADLRLGAEGITIRGSIVGPRKDLAEAVQFAASGKVEDHVHQARSRTSTALRQPQSREGRRAYGPSEHLPSPRPGP